METSRQTWLLAKLSSAEKSKEKLPPGINCKSEVPVRLTAKCRLAGWPSKTGRRCAGKLRQGGWRLKRPRSPRLRRQPQVRQLASLHLNPQLLTLERRLTDEFPQQTRDWSW